jgi:AraC-like DNA-binding protein
MIENIISLFTGSLGFIIFLLMVFRFKNNQITNMYFIVFIFLSSIRFLCYGLLDIFPSLLNYHKQINISFILIVWPLLYLYFKKLIKEHATFKKKDLLHFVAPILMINFIWFKNYINSEVFIMGWKIGAVISIITSAVYAIACYKLLKKNVWNRNSDVLLINQQNKIIKQWTQILFALLILMFVRFIFNLAVNNDVFWFKNKNHFIWLAALTWIGMYLKMLHSPEIIYGYDEFQKKIKEYKKHTIVFDNIWITNKPKEITNVQDVILEGKTAIYIENYILSIEDLAINSDHFFAKNTSTTDLANKLNIPKSHVLYIFKYHSKIKFSHFRKIIRIQKTILLIEEGYLKKDTMESLASVAGFTSYSSFFKSFKSITGVSPQEYVRD